MAVSWLVRWNAVAKSVPFHCATEFGAKLLFRR
jgi:hypothetical protein